MQSYRVGLLPAQGTMGETYFSNSTDTSLSSLSCIRHMYEDTMYFVVCYMELSKLGQIMKYHEVSHLRELQMRKEA